VSTSAESASAVLSTTDAAVSESSERGCSPTQSWEGPVCVTHADEVQAAMASYRWAREQFGTAAPSYRYDDIYQPTLDYWYRSRSYSRERLPENFRNATSPNGYYIDDLSLIHGSSDGHLLFEAGYTVGDRGPFFHAKLVFMRHDGNRWRIAAEAAMSRFPDDWQPLLMQGTGGTLTAGCGVFWNTANPGASEWTLVQGTHRAPNEVQEVLSDLDTCFGLDMRGNRAGMLHTWRLPTRSELHELLSDLPPAAESLPASLQGAVSPADFPPNTRFWVEAEGQPVVVARSSSGELTVQSSQGTDARLYAVRLRREP
jgi:hypothetical protein